MIGTQVQISRGSQLGLVEKRLACTADEDLAPIFGIQVEQRLACQ